MAASESWAAQVTFARLVSKGVPAEKIQIPNLLALIPDALKRLAKVFAGFPAEDPKRQLFESETTVTLTDGVGSLAALELANYLPDSIDPGKIFHADSIYPLQEVTDRAMLSFPWPDFYLYFCIAGNQIRTRDQTGDSRLTSLQGDLTVTAVKILAIADLPEQLWTEFLDEMEVLATPGGH